MILTNIYKQVSSKKKERESVVMPKFISDNIEIIRDVTEVIHPANLVNAYKDFKWCIDSRDRFFIGCYNRDGNLVLIYFEGDGMVSIVMFNGITGDVIEQDSYDTHSAISVEKAQHRFAKLLADKFKVHLLVK